MVRTRSLALVAAALLALTACGDAASNGSSSSAGAAGTPSSARPAVVPGCKPAPQPRPAEKVPTFTAAPDKSTAAGRTFVATMSTNCGDIVLELDGKKAPQTVASFQQLAEKGYWEDSPCHRLTTSGIFVLQCGDPTGTGSGGPGYGFGIENAPADGSFPEGTLAMARSQDPDSNGGQFFLVYQDSVIDPAYGGYSIFGKVTQGIDLLKQIAAAGLAGRGEYPAQDISITKVTVTEKKA